jgi:hypothetical protein
MRLNLTIEETEALREILENYLAELRMEIVGTDRAEYREKLKTRKHMIESILTGMPAEVR